MGLTQTVYQTVTCNGPNCTKTVTFAAAEEQVELAKPENAWVATARVVTDLKQNPNPQAPKRVFIYCSDICEIEATQAGMHNPPEAKRLITFSGNPGQVAAAAAAAKKAEEATKALKAGQPVTLS
jgi:hypothetical protein